MITHPEEFDLLDTQVTPFLIINAIAAICAFIWLIILFRDNRFLFAKPSVVLLVATHFLFQWPLAVYSGFFEQFLPNPAVMPILVHTYIFVGLFLSVYMGSNATKHVWRQLIHEDDTVTFHDRTPTMIAFVICFLIIAGFFFFVPIRETGLFAVIFVPEKADYYRSYSFTKLPLLMQYAYQLFESSLAPFTVCLFALWGERALAQRRLLTVIPIALAIGLILVSVALTGARYSAVKVLLALIAVLGYEHGIPWKPLRYGFILCVILIPAALLTLMREGNDLTVGNLVWYLGRGIFVHRMFVVPLQVGAWHIHYTQIHDLFGISAVQKLAILLGADSVSVPRLIGSEYAHSSTIETWSNAGYLFSYYSYFGSIAIVFNIALLLLLDYALVVYKHLSGNVLLAAVATVAVTMLDFIKSDYTTALISHGFVCTLLLALLLQQFSVKGSVAVDARK